MNGNRSASAALLALFVVACGGGNEPADSGTGRDARARLDAELAVCERNDDCFDELFCNGQERCMPGAEGADARGCVSGPPACDADCDEERDVCSGCATDADEDGAIAVSCGGNDCDDDDPAVRGGGNEVCDAAGVDEDCNPDTIQSALEDGDLDGDGHVAMRCFNVRADGTENRGDDCDDAVAGVHPGAADGCGGGDEDCDGRIDEEGGRTYYRDADVDGFGTADDTMISCEMPAGYVSTPGDCDDADRMANPTRDEVCGGADEDCDGMVDESGAADAGSYYPDVDGDGHGASDVMAMRSCTPVAGHVGGNSDCNDRDARVFLNAEAFDREPHCRVGLACIRSSGAWDCVGVTPVGDACPDSAASVGLPSFDFDCDGFASPAPAWSLAGQPCTWSGTGCTVYPAYPTGSHAAADCGALVPYTACQMTGTGMCGWVESPLPLECR